MASSSLPLHPSQRFVAPSHIHRGISLAALLDAEAIDLIWQSFHQVDHTFPQLDAEQLAADTAKLGLMARAEAIARVLAQLLPADPLAQLQMITASLGPPLTKCADNGLAVMFYLPWSYLIAAHAVPDQPLRFSAGLDANAAVTQRFTAEFCLRPYLLADFDQVQRRLETWCQDDNPHIRRLVSEGTRPRLPWGMRLKPLQQDPTPVLPWLRLLRRDPERYVTRSVANHLGDIGKDHPQLLFKIAHQWLADAATWPHQERKELHWLIRHAVRYHAKKGEPTALELRSLAK